MGAEGNRGVPSWGPGGGGVCSGSTHTGSLGSSKGRRFLLPPPPGRVGGGAPSSPTPTAPLPPTCRSARGLRTPRARLAGTAEPQNLSAHPGCRDPGHRDWAPTPPSGPRAGLPPDWPRPRYFVATAPSALPDGRPLGAASPEVRAEHVRAGRARKRRGAGGSPAASQAHPAEQRSRPPRGASPGKVLGPSHHPGVEGSGRPTATFRPSVPPRAGSPPCPQEPSPKPLFRGAGSGRNPVLS